MERNRKYLIISLIILLIFTLFPLYADDNTEPEWILYRKGINFYNRKDFSEAFKYFRDASRKRDFPEAEYYLGRIFENEGEFSLALKQYEIAESYQDSLFTDDFIKNIVLQKAEVYRKLNKHNQYQETMINLIGKIAEEKRITHYLTILPDLMMKNGLDKLFYYYRLDGDEIIYPTGELGVYYFTLSQDNNTIKYLTPAVTAVLSKAFVISRKYDPEYSFENLEKFISDLEKSENTANYLQSSHFYKYLFYISLAIHNAGDTDETFRLLKIISKSRLSGKYGNISERIINNSSSPLYIEKIKESLLVDVE